MVNEKIKRLIEVKEQLLALQDEEKELKNDLLLNDFEYEKVWSIEIAKKQRASITLANDVDLKTIRLQYPEVCNTHYWVDVKKLTADELEEIKQKYNKAYYEDISVDAKALHNLTKDYTKQSLTTYIEVRGI